MMFGNESFPEVDAVFTVRYRIDESGTARVHPTERRRAPRCGGLTFGVDGRVCRGTPVFVVLRSRNDRSLHFECLTHCERCWWENGRWMISVRFADADAGLLQSIYTMLSLFLRQVEIEGKRKSAEG